MKGSPAAVFASIVIGLAWIGWGAPVAAATTSSEPPLTVDALRVAPKIREVVLAPTGDRLAVLLREDYGQSVWIVDLEDPGATPRKLSDARGVQRLLFDRDGSTVFLDTGRRVGRLDVAGGRPAWIVELDPEREQALAEVDPTRPGHLLITETVADDHYRLVRLDAQGASETIFEAATPISDYWLDAEGVPTFVKTIDGDEQVIEWWRGTRRDEVLRCPPLDPCGLVAFDGERLWMRTRRAGQGFGDRWHLVAVDPTTGDGTPVHGDPERLADLGRVVVGSADRQPLMVSYDTDRRRTFGLDPESEALLRRLRERFADANLDVQAEDRGRFWLIEASGPRLHHPRFHVVDTRDGSVREVLGDERRSVAAIPPERLVEQRPITYRASDGMTLYGYVWLPRGIDPRSAPVIALVHGGPWNRDRYTFHGAAQLFVDRGYIVFQPNFRGSSGYGLDYLLAAKGELSGGRVHQDIVDGLDHLAARGWGDPARTAIVGHSYGGFASLAAAIAHPQRYRAAVATAAPIDLVRAFRDLTADWVTPNGLPLEVWMREAFVDLDDPEAVAEERRRSPEARVEASALPLLLMAGGRDEKVSITDVRHYAAQLDARGQDVSLLVDDEAGHSFETPQMAVARTVLTERFLGRWLGGAVVPVDDPELDAYIRSRMVLTGPSLESGDDGR